VKFGVIGLGKQGKKYLDPKNWPEGVECVPHAGGSVDAAIVSSPPGAHVATCADELALGRPVLCEKPVGLTKSDANTLLRIAAAERVPFMVAFTHLWSTEFLSIAPSPGAVVICGGEERDDGSCPAWLDWGAHAWAMANALGTRRVTTGKMPQRKLYVSSGDVLDGGKRYVGESQEWPMKAMLVSFATICSGGYDWRADPEFIRKAHEDCWTGR
jgi:hypothetical protein